MAAFIQAVQDERKRRSIDTWVRRALIDCETMASRPTNEIMLSILQVLLVTCLSVAIRVAPAPGGKHRTLIKRVR